MTTTDNVRGKHAVIAIVGLVLAAAWFAARIIANSGRPGNYYQYRHSAEGFVYPTSGVAISVGLIAVEVLLVSWLLLRASSGAKAS